MAEGQPTTTLNVHGGQGFGSVGGTANSFRSQTTNYFYANLDNPILQQLGQRAPLPELSDTFVGRETDIKEIERNLASIGNVVALTGLAGIGKSQLARKYCQNIRVAAPATRILWLDCAENCDKSFLHIAQELSVLGVKDQAWDVKAKVRGWLENPKNRGSWIVVLDDAHDKIAREAAQYIPFSEGRTIVTSQSHSLPCDIKFTSQVIRIGPLPLNEAKQLLRLRAAPASSPCQLSDDNLDDLLQVLDCHPLGVIQAAAHLRKSHGSRHAHESQKQFIDSMRNEEYFQEWAHRDHRVECLGTSLECQFDRILINGTEEAATLLSQLAFLDPGRVQSDLLIPNSTHSYLWENAQHRLLSQSLLLEDDETDNAGGECMPGSRSFSMRPFVQCLLKHWLTRSVANSPNSDREEDTRREKARIQGFDRAARMIGSTISATPSDAEVDDVYGHGLAMFEVSAVPGFHTNHPQMGSSFPATNSQQFLSHLSSEAKKQLARVLYHMARVERIRKDDDRAERHQKFAEDIREHLLRRHPGREDNDSSAPYNASCIFSGLQEASWCGHEEAVRLALKNGADVNEPGGEYGNALQAASLTGSSRKVVVILIESGARVNAQGGAYGSALQAASWAGHAGIVQLLIAKGADVNARGGRYGSALAAAKQAGHDVVIRALHRKGATDKE